MFWFKISRGAADYFKPLRTSLFRGNDFNETAIKSLDHNWKDGFSFFL